MTPFPPPGPTASDLTLDEMREALAAELPTHAAFDGWGEVALARAAAALGLDPGQARLAFPDGPTGMIEAWYGTLDVALARAFPPERIAAMKMRERIEALVLARLALLRPDREAARRALVLLVQPHHAATAARLGWRAADRMWRLAGDIATDLSHYTKRMTLAAVYAATLLVWLDDGSEGESETQGFLQRRLAEVMRFETLKAKLRTDPERRFSFTRLAGRLRYPVG